MNGYLLDTDICIFWLNGNEKIRKKVKKVGTVNLKASVITFAELRFGAYNSLKVKENLENINNFFRKVKVLLLDQDAADRFGKIKANLRRKGEIIGDFDILIASIALSHDETLVTNNTDHFERISELKYENWLEK